MPFRTAYKVTGAIVSECISRGIVLEDMTLDEYKNHSELFSDDLYEEISLKTCVAKRISEGATGYESVEIQLKNFNNFLNTTKGN
jgi:argininosuccinate lyase